MNNNQKSIFPTKTKIAALLMIIIGFLAFPLVFFGEISSLHWGWWCSILYFISAIFLPLIFFFLFLLFPIFLLKKKRWGWWGSIIALSFCILSTVYNFVSYNSASLYSFLGGESGKWIDVFLLFYILILILFLVDKKRYWEISSPIKIPIKIKITRKIKILIGILITIILIGGWWIWDSYHPQGEVTMFTDKTNYETGETTKITVKNGLNKVISYAPECNGSPWWELRKLEEEEWKPISVYLPPKSESGVIIMHPFHCNIAKLESGSDISYFWDFKKTNFKKTNDGTEVITEFTYPGIYKFSFRYGYGFSKETIYSNEFTIKEKVEDETADWKTYRNEEYGFEISYPLKEMLWEKISIFDFYRDSKYKGIRVGELVYGCTPTIYPEIDDDFLSLLDDWKEAIGEPPYPIYEIIKSDTGKTYYFGFSIASHAVNIEECQPIFNQMLSTFRFLE